MRYVILLRGVNVGGRNKVNMPELKKQLEDAGFMEIKTYLNSGNVLADFDGRRDEAVIQVRRVLKTAYDFDIPFALLTADMLKADLQSVPLWWSEPLARRDALFPTEGTDFDTVKADVASMPLSDETIHFGEHVILWGKRDERTYGRTAYHRLLIQRPYYRKLTIRNGNTFDTLSEWIQKRL